MLRYGFFDSEITGYDEEGMPLFDRAESSDFLAEFISRIVSSGVLATPGDCFQVVADEGMKLKIRPGFGVIRGRFAMDTKDYSLAIGTADASYRRIDRVILRANYLQRKCEIIVREGTPGTDPAVPELLQPESGDYYELCLALVSVNSNQSIITQANITDTRYSEDCGVVTQAIDHLDTSVFSAQMDQYFKEYVEKSESLFNEWFDSMKDQLSEDAAGNLLGLIMELKENAEKKAEEIQKELGNTDISGIGDGTVTGAISSLNTGMEWTKVWENENDNLYGLNYPGKILSLNLDGYHEFRVVFYVNGTGSNYSVTADISSRIDGKNASASIVICNPQENGGIIIEGRELIYNKHAHTMTIKDGWRWTSPNAYSLWHGQIKPAYIEAR